MEANNKAAMREALDKIGNISAFVAENCDNSDTAKYMNDIISIVHAALDEQKYEAKWKLGFEYEFAYCSHCGHQQWAGWDSYRKSIESIGEFHKEYKFCPSCGFEMKGANNGQ